MQSVLTSNRLGLRTLRLFAGLFAYGIAIALMIRGNLGSAPWDVLSQGIARATGMSFGWATVAISALVLLLWIPLRQKPGAGTIANALLVGFFADIGLLVIPHWHHLAAQVLSFGSGLLLLAAASALYIGAGLGPGPRDGLMTGLHAVTGWQVWIVRTGIEAAVTLAGWLLGGVVGLGTLVFVLAIGPLIQLFLKWMFVDLTPGARKQTCADPVRD
jgi:uncharacterized membrane protein YczE